VARVPVVAPFDSCVVCLKGDVTTAVAFRGDAEWSIAALTALGVPDDQAYGVFRAAMEDQGWTGDPDEVPGGEVVMGLRVCAECVEKSGTGFPLGDASGEVPVVTPK
jgi:hypothetical protein